MAERWLFCRKISKIQKLQDRQDNLVKDGKYIIILTDADINQLVKYKLNSMEDEIDDFLEEKFKKLT